MLGSFNLVKYVDDDRRFDFAAFRADIPLAVEFLDTVIDNTIYPLEDQRQEALNKRRMGLGVTGVANALERMGFPYGSDGFNHTLGLILECLRDNAYVASVRLARDKGAFPLFRRDQYLAGQFIQTLPDDIKTLIATYGIRNSHLISIAPTGTISLCADNISSGIEPVFTHEYTRTMVGDDGDRTELVQDYAYCTWGLRGVTALELTPEDHIGVLAVAQRYCDSAVSKTVNIGDDITYEQFKNVYITAYRNGAKGCTTFRAAGKRMGILQATVPPTTSDTEPTPLLLAAPEGEACTFDIETGRKTCE